MKEKTKTSIDHQGDHRWMIRWSVIHSIFCVSVTIFSLFTGSPLPLIFVGALSFSALVFSAFQQSNTEQLINPSNIVTASRLTGILILAGFGMTITYSLIIGLSTGFMLLDCLDGWLARKRNTETEFGAFFDKEIDAYFMLLLCLLLVLRGHLDPWILSIGFFRYFFVVLVYFLGVSIQQEERTSRAQHIFTAVMIILLALFLPIHFLRVPLAILILLLLVYSFGSDMLKIFLKPDRRCVPTPYSVEDPSDIKDFFNKIASDFTDPHGDPEKLFDARMRLIKESVHLRENCRIIEIGCGTGQHLLALMDEKRVGLGVDISSRMIDEARQRASSSPYAGRVAYEIDDAQSVHTVPDASIDVVLCVGALEHMPDKHAVFENVFRVLKAGGQFVCLTPNGQYTWYRRIAPLLEINTKHLSSDEFITRRRIQDMLDHFGFTTVKIGYWTFIPRGDMPSYMGVILQFLDLLGKTLRISSLRGGILFTAIKPQS